MTSRAPGFAVLAGLALLPAHVLGAQVLAACPSAGDDSAMIAAVESRLELKLDDGRLIRLAGLDPVLASPTDPDLAERARTALSTRLKGKRVGLAVLADNPDRWGRFPALAFPADDPPAEGGLAARLLAEGSGRYAAEPAGNACRDTLLAAETKARSAKLGLWRDPYYGVLAVDDRTGLAARSGTIVVAEGRLASVQPGPYRTTLRFDPPGADSFGGHMLVATIVPRAMKSFGAQHMDFSTLVGRRLRLRGLLDLRFGPRIELQTPDQVEALDAPAPRN